MGSTLDHGVVYIICIVMFVLLQAAFRVGSSTRLDDRVVVLENCKTQPLCYLLMSVYPDLYPVHALDDKVFI